MLDLNTIDLLLLSGTTYLAVITLVRLMRQRRERVIKDLTEQVEFEQERLKAERKKNDGKC